MEDGFFSSTHIQKSTPFRMFNHEAKSDKGLVEMLRMGIGLAED